MAAAKRAKRKKKTAGAAGTALSGDVLQAMLKCEALLRKLADQQQLLTGAVVDLDGRFAAALASTGLSTVKQDPQS